EDLYSLDKYPMILPGLVEMLDAQSADRRKALEEFHYLDESIAFFSERYNRNEIPLKLTERLSRIYTDKQISDALEKRRDTLAEMAFESVPVLLHENTNDGETVAKASSLNPSDELELVFPDDEAAKGESDSEEEEQEDRKPFDIQKREAVRIMCDWIQIETRIQAGDQQRQMALAELKESMGKASGIDTGSDPVRN
ncbi:MAG TPA: carboxy terminal-processing peptidase, partial [Opitutales bacterium]|nr:carboxy terminal-processing peptidase [Opitutales bacterium]